MKTKYPLCVEGSCLRPTKIMSVKRKRKGVLLNGKVE